MQLSRDSAAGLICLALSLSACCAYARAAAVLAGADRAGFLSAHRARHHGGVLSALLIVIDVLSMRRKRDIAETAPAPQRPRRSATTGWSAVTFVVFAALRALLPLARLSRLDFPVRRGAAGGARAAASARALGHRARHPRLATALVTYVVFEHYLSVLLPRGRWTGMVNDVRTPCIGGIVEHPAPEIPGAAVRSARSSD